MSDAGGKRAVTMLTACLVLAGCDYGPAVPGGQPALAYEAKQSGSSRRSVNIATIHFYEVSPEDLRHPAQLEGYFRWACKVRYVLTSCRIFVWPAGQAPHHGVILSRSEIAGEVAYYRLERDTGQEEFKLNPAEPLLR